MNNAKKITTLALAISLSLGGGIALAADNVRHAEDESSSATQAVGDAWITTKVKAELAIADGVSSTDISVTTVDGVVTLTGVLPTRTSVDAAIAHTRSVKGVLDVDAAGLKVGDPAKVAASDRHDSESTTLGQKVDDTWITTKVKAELATTDGVSSTDISVKTVDGVVTLTGALSSELAVKKAIAAARSVEGVRQVDASALRVAG
ncbi:BON domain-containing protein [Xanthomonadaceae bacterium JHOS43]|nr:BON domain-containing protein [Xanthomonadaceae bacterium JHOS43]MCX7562749.1 BON domain-containing protein [Xanthomonadaceae bacterium XH05]